MLYGKLPDMRIHIYDYNQKLCEIHHWHQLSVISINSYKIILFTGKYFCVTWVTYLSQLIVADLSTQVPSSHTDSCFMYLQYISYMIWLIYVSLLDLQSCQRSVAECCVSFGWWSAACRVRPWSSACSSEPCCYRATAKSSSSPLSSGSTITPRSAWASSNYLCSPQIHRRSEVRDPLLIK